MVEQWVVDAEAAHAGGRLQDAEASAKRVLEVEPESARANTIAGLVEAKTGRVASAIERFKIVFQQDPSSFEAKLWLSMLYRMSGNLKESIEFAELAIRAKPQEAQVHSNLGLSLLAAHELDRAVSTFQKAVSLNPTLAPNYLNLGKALQLQARDDESILAFRKALSLSPNSLETIFALGQSLMNLMETAGAIDCSQRALKLNPRSAAAHLLWASALIAEGKTTEAEAHIDQAIALDPRDANALVMLGMRMQALGRLEQANACFLRSIEAVPDQGFAYLALMRNHKVGEADRDLVLKMTQLTHQASIPQRGQSYLHFGLGKAYEDLKEYEKAMGHFDEANRIGYRLRIGDRKFDRKQYASVFDWTINTFTPDFLEKHRGSGSESDAPIFIVGMMRSGTTLVEQILSSHPDVDARGEQPFWMTKRLELISIGSHTVDLRHLKKLSSQYLESMQAMGNTIPRFTDKMPDNFIPLGLIHLAFPNARIIHTMRNPIDTCISIYTTPNRTAVMYANNRENIVFAYEQYLRLMEHWRQVIPSDRLFEVQYEDLISDRETLTRRMVEFCGLGWSDACLHPEDNERTVATPSVWQVRQPVYTTSVERWRRYEPWLGSFAKLKEHR